MPDRRSFTAGLGAVLSLPALMNTALAGTMREELMLAENPPNVDPSAPGLDVFHRLSQLLTLRMDLPIAASGKVFAIFQDEPWWEIHVSELYAALVSAIERDGANADIGATTADGAVRTAVHWFARRVLFVWYLGVYIHEHRPHERVLYDEALIHRTIAEFAPVPGFSEDGFGSWSERPDTGGRRW